MIRKILQIFREIFLDPMPLNEFSDYDDYWEKRGRQEPKHRFVWVARRLPERGRVLDIGCGDGAFLEYTRDIRPDLDLLGIDGSAAAIRKLGEKGLEGALVGDLNSPDLTSFREVDVIVAMELIEHLPEPELLMREFLKTKAHVFYITIPNLGFVVNRLRLALGGKMPLTAIVYHIKEHLRFWTVRDFHVWAAHCGFNVREYAGQNGFFGLWRIFPSLFARQMIYVLERRDS
ncbi:methyltransferase domain-containing protein [Akkermansiaceae bacterium]|nr:methyltransferase domain-containing protein [Akkermansiaceae bacterium]